MLNIFNEKVNPAVKLQKFSFSHFECTSKYLQFKHSRIVLGLAVNLMQANISIAKYIAKIV